LEENWKMAEQLWLCFAVVTAFASSGVWFALRMFNRSVR
jgi:hypothetical protein